MMPAEGAGDGGGSGKRRKPTREQRLEAELRENLKRRKDQSRARRGRDETAEDAGPDDHGEATGSASGG